MNHAISFAALLALGSSSFAEPLLEDGSFEVPPVIRRKSIAEGGDISKASSEWVRFIDKRDADGGRIILGLTNEIARTGRQCVFVHFDNVTKPLATAMLSSELISILPGKTYHVSIWGRVDRENPVALDQRLPYIKLRVDWFQAPPKEGEEDETNPTGAPEQTGEVEYRVQPMPGSKNRRPLFTAARWTEFYADLKAPDDAATMKVTWTWETPPQEGATNGVIYFDDANVDGAPGPKEDLFEEAPEPASDDAKQPAEPARPVEAPKPAAPAPPASPKSPDVTPVSTPPPRDPKKDGKAK
jgi:hypothetical protein